MDLKVYERTRYQNIYRHKKNKNYVVMISKPVKTSISRIDNKKIFSTEEAIKIRDNYLVKLQKGAENSFKCDFDTIWEKYIYSCKYVKKLAYNTLNRKQKTYSKYLKNKINKNITKLDKLFWVKYIDQCNATLIQKNQIIKEVKALYNWCIEENIAYINPIIKIKKYTIPKAEMKYWTPSELKRFLDIVNNDVLTETGHKKEVAYTIKIFTLIGFSLGDRTGETRAITFDCINQESKTLRINHSINYNRNDDDFLSKTKNYQSQRIIDITDKLINEINMYKKYLIIDCEYDVKSNSLIFFNYNTNKPLTDTTIRKHFYKYCDKANVKRIRLYDLRHTYVATMMSENMELYNISERIGHSSYKTTVDKYGHLSNEIRKEVAKTTDKYY